MFCGVGACPVIFETNGSTYVIIGKKLAARKLGISKRIAKDEVLIEISKNLIDNKSIKKFLKFHFF